MKQDFNADRPELFSERVKAGKRTYFLDVKATRGNDYFITITESKKTTLQDGTAVFDKHKIFLYKEDLLKFADALQGAIEYMRQLMPDYDFEGSASEDEDYNRHEYQEKQPVEKREQGSSQRWS